VAAPSTLAALACCCPLPSLSPCRPSSQALHCHPAATCTSSYGLLPQHLCSSSKQQAWYNNSYIQPASSALSLLTALSTSQHLNPCLCNKTKPKPQTPQSCQQNPAPPGHVIGPRCALHMSGSRPHAHASSRRVAAATRARSAGWGSCRDKEIQQHCLPQPMTGCAGCSNAWSCII
jgi:hypothetical protein